MLDRSSKLIAVTDRLNTIKINFLQAVCIHTNLIISIHNEILVDVYNIFRTMMVGLNPYLWFYAIRVCIIW